MGSGQAIHTRAKVETPAKANSTMDKNKNIAFPQKSASTATAAYIIITNERSDEMQLLIVLRNPLLKAKVSDNHEASFLAGPEEAILLVLQH